MMGRTKGIPTTWYLFVHPQMRPQVITTYESQHGRPIVSVESHNTSYITTPKKWQKNIGISTDLDKGLTGNFNNGNQFVGCRESSNTRSRNVVEDNGFS